MPGRPPRPAAAGRRAPGAENPPGQPKAPKWQLETGNIPLLSFVSMVTGRKREQLPKQEAGRRERRAGFAKPARPQLANGTHAVNEAHP